MDYEWREEANIKKQIRWMFENKDRQKNWRVQKSKKKGLGVKGSTGEK